MPGTVEFDVELLKTEKNNEKVKYLVESITDKEATLKELEAELECVVCLETGSSPLYCCQEQHLVCSTCMPGVLETGKCPSSSRGETSSDTGLLRGLLRGWGHSGRTLTTSEQNLTLF